MISKKLTFFRVEILKNHETIMKHLPAFFGTVLKLPQSFGK